MQSADLLEEEHLEPVQPKVPVILKEAGRRFMRGLAGHDVPSHQTPAWPHCHFSMPSDNAAHSVLHLWSALAFCAPV